MSNRIKIDASPDEFSSPFFMRHQQICKEWEKFVLSHDGLVKGKFNSWALILMAKFKIKREWYVELKKSIMSDTAILLPSKANVLEYTLLKCDSANLTLPSFEIRKKGWLGRIRIHFFSKFKAFGSVHVFRSDKSGSYYNHELIEILKRDSLISKLEFAKYNSQTNQLEIKFLGLMEDVNLLKDLLSI